MIALKIVKNGSFMSKILAGDAFDSFLLEEARIRMAVTWDIDGHLNEQFYPADVWKDPEQRPYDRTQWKEIRPYIYDIIKVKQAPSSFHFVLLLKPEHVTALLEQAGESQLDAFVQSFLITVRFSDSVMTIVTGTAYKSFTLDKSADTLWDKSLQKFLTSRQIDFELMS